MRHSIYYFTFFSDEMPVVLMFSSSWEMAVKLCSSSTSPQKMIFYLPLFYGTQASSIHFRWDVLMQLQPSKFIWEIDRDTGEKDLSLQYPQLVSSLIFYSEIHWQDQTFICRKETRSILIIEHYQHSKGRIKIWLTRTSKMYLLYFNHSNTHNPWLITAKD